MTRTTSVALQGSVNSRGGIYSPMLHRSNGNDGDRQVLFPNEAAKGSGPMQTTDQAPYQSHTSIFSQVETP